MKISAVIIGQHEEAMLPDLLESLKGFDEIVFCYTGDTAQPDGTLDIVKKYTDNICYFRWCDSFCKARNAAKAHATGDWILSIDCDEVLHDVGAVREAVALAEKQAARAVDVRMIANDNGQFFMFPRLFKNDQDVFWAGNVHNHLSVIGVTLGDVRITHRFSPAHALDPDRSLRMLENDVKENNGPREMFYLGREYYYRGRYQEAVTMLGKYVQLSRYLAEKADAFLIMSRSYWAMGMHDDARDAIVQSLIINAHFKEAITWMSQIAGDGSGNERWQANADQWKRMAETANNNDVLFVRN